jgi:hypothetical protein
VSFRVLKSSGSINRIGRGLFCERRGSGPCRGALARVEGGESSQGVIIGKLNYRPGGGLQMNILKALQKGRKRVVVQLKSIDAAIAALSGE